jgi:hypothetical protein
MRLLSFTHTGVLWRNPTIPSCRIDTGTRAFIAASADPTFQFHDVLPPARQGLSRFITSPVAPHTAAAPIRPDVGNGCFLSFPASPSFPSPRQSHGAINTL